MSRTQRCSPFSSYSEFRFPVFACSHLCSSCYLLSSLTPPSPLPNPVFWGCPRPAHTFFGCPSTSLAHVGLSKSMWDVCLFGQVSQRRTSAARGVVGMLGVTCRSKGWRVDFNLGRGGHPHLSRGLPVSPLHSLTRPTFIQQLIITELAHSPARPEHPPH